MKEDREFGPFGSVIISDHLEILAEFQGKVFHFYDRAAMAISLHYGFTSGVTGMQTL
jgi:hypothetical protein